jgi:signal transduction histidine kinase/DNA-binding response OmpR family regulator
VEEHMGLLENISIRKRLISTLIIWMIIIIGFGAISIVKMQRLAKVTQSIYDRPMKISNAASKVDVDILKINTEMRDTILSDNEAQIEKHIEIVNSLEKEIYSNMDIIKSQSSSEEVKSLDIEIRKLLYDWSGARQDIVELIKKGDTREATKLSQSNTESYAEEIENDLGEINKLQGTIASDLVINADDIEGSEKLMLILSLTFLGIIAIILFTLIIRSVTKSFEELKSVISTSTSTGELLECKIHGKNELVDISRHFNTLIQKLRMQFWIKDGQNKLLQEIAGNHSINKLTQKSINSLARLLEAGNGVFYLYNEEENALYLNASFAFTEKEVLHNKYTVGEGIVGQVAQEKKAILLKNIRKEDKIIATGTIKAVPLNIYAFPVTYEHKLYGVIELSSFEAFTELKQEFLKEISEIIGINLYAAIQNEKIRKLLEESQKSKLEIQITADELKRANDILEEQRTLLQYQTEELQKNNIELEEQQQLLQQQSAELQQSNAQLEEQQQLLEEQSGVLNNQNKELEISKEELIRRSNELELTNKYKSEFLANMSHELRTPLNSIILLSKLLINSKKHRLDSEEVEKIGIIYASGNELLRLINDILDLSKVEAGKMNLYITEFNSKDFLEDLKNLFQGMVKEKNIEFIIEDRINGQLIGDRDKISQILRNLISNALKFTEQGSVILKLEKDNENSDGIIFLVEDTGIGIAENKIHMVFEAFQQGDGSISRKYGGTGLGLSISKKLVELMKGKIEVESSIGVGSNFKLKLPNAIKNYYESEKVEDLVAITKDKFNKVIETEVLKKNDKFILIVGDNIKLIEYVREINRGMGFGTLVTNKTKEIFRYLKEYEIRGIILGLIVSYENKINILEELRNCKDFSNMPVYIITEKEFTIADKQKFKKYDYAIISKLEDFKIRFKDEVTLFLNDIRKNNKDNYLLSKIDKECNLSLKDKNILIVDDDPRNIFILASALESFEAEVIDAENGTEALEKLERYKVDLILMDIMMPIMDGYETIREIRKNRKLKDIPIIALSAKSLKEDREKCIKVGADDYISKPVDYDIFVRLIKIWISKKNDK